MRKKEIVDEAQGLVLHAKYEQFKWAKRAAEQARLELGGVIANVGLSAAARSIGRSRQWCLQVVQTAEKEAQEDKARREKAEKEGSDTLLPDASDLIESVRRSGILEPIIVGVADDDTLKVVDGHRRLMAAREAGVTSLPVMLSLISSDEAAELRAPAEEAARSHRRVTFRYARPDGVEALRTVDVWGVVRRAEHAYLIGYDQDRQAARTFRLSRVVGGITFLGEGTPPPEGFSAEASVWGPLDPESLEALEESFRKILQEQRSSDEDLTTGDVTSEEARASVQTEIDKLQAQRKSIEVAEGRLSAAEENAYEWQRQSRALLESMNSSMGEFLEAISEGDQQLKAATASDGPEAHHHELEATRQRLLRLLETGESLLSDINVLQEAMRKLDALRKRRQLDGLLALDQE